MRNTSKQVNISSPQLPKNIIGIKRAFETLWKYNLSLLTGTIFAFPDEALLNGIDNISKDLQLNGLNKETQNVL